MMASLVEAISHFLDGWNVYTSILLIIVVALTSWTVYSNQEPDIHPLLLARQASVGYVRQPGESAVYRSSDIPLGFSLVSGLGVRGPGVPAYAPGKNGDLRDIWRRVTGELGLGSQADPHKPGKIVTVMGRKETIDHDIGEISTEINIIGTHLKDHGAKRIAVYLPNSVEFLASLFAGSFYGFSLVLVPYNQSVANLVAMLRNTKVDGLIAEAGSLPLDFVSKEVQKLRQVVWVVEKTSRHVDWNEVPEGFGGKIDVSVWHELVEDVKGSATPELPQHVEGYTPPNIITIWQDKIGGDGNITEFTQANFAAATAAMINSLPPKQRLCSADTVLPADSLTHSYTLTVTLAALFSKSKVALNSVAGTGVQIGLAIRNVSPTVIVMSAESAVGMHSSAAPTLKSGSNKYSHYLQARALRNGRMPTASIMGDEDEGGISPKKLRLIYIAERAGADTPPLTPEDLIDLRIFTRSRIVYALTAAQVAGSVAQTHIFDYRSGKAPPTKHSHFGTPPGCLEIKLKDTSRHQTTDEQAIGEIIVAGPAVAGGQASLGIDGTFREDHTLAYV